MSDASGCQCYAVRRNNPFQGVLQIIDIGQAKAMSKDGVLWMIQVLAQETDNSETGNYRLIRQFINFGSWQQEYGLRQTQRRTVMDVGQMLGVAQILVETIEQQVTRLPFPLCDHYEYWATETDGTPVALLASTRDAQRLTEFDATGWHACLLTEHSFTSKTLLKNKVPQNGDMGPRQHAEHLESFIRHAAQHRYWFQRLPDGGGIRLNDANRTQLAANAFPQFLLKQDWDDPEVVALVKDYICWVAPRLLTLQHLSTEQRTRLEQAAFACPLELDAHYRLYPQIINPEALNTARVEARIRQANPDCS